MQPTALKKIATCFCLIMFSTLSAEAVEIELKEQVRCTGTVVRLGDVAELRGGTPEQQDKLRQLILFPAPSRNGQRVFRSKELQELLLLHQIELTAYQLSGARNVLVLGEQAEAKGPTSPGPSSPGPVSAVAVREKLQTIFAEHLEAQHASGDWDVRIPAASSGLLRLASAELEELTVQRAELKANDRWSFLVAAGASEPVAIDAEASQRTAVVVTARPVERGVILQKADLVLEPVEGNRLPADALRNLESAIGKEARRSLAAGQVVQEDALQAPVLVKSREIVTVAARAAGVTVTTTARALGEGALGELVTVEAQFDGRGQKAQRYQARVVGPKQVEVFVAGPQIPAVARSTENRPSMR